MAIPGWNLVRIIPSVYFVLVVVAAMLTGLDVSVVVALLTASLFVQMGASWGLYRTLGVVRGAFSRSEVMPMLRYGIANMASTAPNSLNGRVDQLVLAFLVPAAALGQYAVAVSLSLLVRAPRNSVRARGFPRHRSRANDVRATIRHAIRGALVVSTLGVSAVVLVTLVDFRVVRARVREVPKICHPCAWCRSVHRQPRCRRCPSRPGSPGLVARGEWFGVLVTVVGLVLLVPTLGVRGCSHLVMRLHRVFVILLVSVRRLARELPGSAGHAAGDTVSD